MKRLNILDVFKAEKIGEGEKGSGGSADHPFSKRQHSNKDEYADRSGAGEPGTSELPPTLVCSTTCSAAQVFA